MADYSFMNTPKTKTSNPFAGGKSASTDYYAGPNDPNFGGAATSLLKQPTAAPTPDPNRTQLAGKAPTYTTPPRPSTSNMPTFDTGMGMPNRTPQTPPPGTQTYNTPTTSMPNTGGNAGGWNLPSWNPNIPAPGAGLSPGQQSGNMAGVGGGESDFRWADPNLFNPDAYKSNDSQTANFVSSTLPVAQFLQNNYQYRSDFNEAQRRYNLDHGLAENQNQFQQSLSTRQQQTAEEQARIAANQWAQQFGWTQQTDQWNHDLSQQSINNQYTQGMDQNQATRDVASTYANANMYGANQQLAGTRYASDADLAAARYQADQSLAQAGLYSQAQRYGAELGLQGQLGSAGMYSDAQRYEADQALKQAGLYSQAQRYGSDQQLAGERYQAQLGLQGQLGSADMYSQAQRYQADQALRQAQLGLQGQLGSAEMYSGAQRYGADQQLAAQLGSAQLGLQGQLGSAGLYSEAQRYGANQQFAGTQYQSDVQARIAAQQNQFLYAQLQQQAQQAEQERANQIALANITAYGRSPSVNASWARSWA